MQNTVENGFPRGFSNNYYRLKKENRLKPSRFEIEFICRDKRFCFGFSAILNSGNIIEEWLYELTASGIKKELYSRNVEESRLLKENVFRNDEISFMLKTGTGSTIIKSLEKYQLRADKKIYEALFDGTLEAIPKFNDILLEKIVKSNLIEK